MVVAPKTSDPAPLPWLSREIFNRVYGILRLRQVPEKEREDLVHEVYVRARQRWGLCRTPNAPEAWIDEIARNVAGDYWRGKKAESKVFDLAKDSVIVGAAVAAPEAEAEVEAERHKAARLDLVRQLLTEIKNLNHREVVTRRLVEGQTPAAIVAALNLPAATVATYHRRGMEQLKAALARHNERKRHELRVRKLAVVVPLPLLGSSSSFFDESLFDHVLDDVEAPESLRDRVLARLQKLPQFGGGGGGPVAPSMPPDAPLALLASPAAVPWSTALVVVACAMVLGATIVLLWDPLGRSRSASTAPTDLRPEAAVASAAPPVPAPSPSATPARPSAQPSSSRGPSEHDVLDKAQRAMGAHDAAGALAAIDEHDRLFKEGARLVEWRERTRIEALIAAGRRPEARARLESFAAAHPDNPHVASFHAQLDAAP